MSLTVPLLPPVPARHATWWPLPPKCSSRNDTV